MAEKSKTDIWMPLYIADYLSSTTRLTTEQHGAYLLLIMDYWKNGRLPNNDAVLANVTRLSIDAWNVHKGVLKGFFKECNGELIHTRIESELSKSEDNKLNQLKRSILGNFKKYGKIDERVKTNPDLQAWWAEISQKESLKESLKDGGKESHKDPSSPSPSPSPSPISLNTKQANACLSPEPTNETKKSQIPAQQIFDLYNEILGNDLPEAKLLTPKRRSAIQARINEAKEKRISIDWWQGYFNHCKGSDFLMGRKGEWKADLDFLISPKLTNVIEGKYHA